MKDNVSVPTSQFVPKNIKRVLLQVAWLSIGLGLIMEVILLLALSQFNPLPGIKPAIADMIQKISWSFLVCSGLAVGTVLARGREIVAGLIGLLSAPIAFNIARIIHRSTAETLDISPLVQGGISPFILTGIKAIEYALLVAIIASLGKRTPRRLGQYVTAGVGIGFIFGGLILALQSDQPQAGLSIPTLASWCVNEIIFPIGCSLVLFTADAFEKQAT